MDKHLFARMTNEYLMMLGFNIGCISYDYLREAIQFCLEDQSLIDGITTRLYPKVAEKFKVKASVIERGIRNIIDKAYQKGGLLEINTLFNKIVYNNDFKFSNSEFIALIVYKIRIDIAKEEIAKKYNIVLPKYYN